MFITNVNRCAGRFAKNGRKKVKILNAVRAFVRRLKARYRGKIPEGCGVCGGSGIIWEWEPFTSLGWLFEPTTVLLSEGPYVCPQCGGKAHKELKGIKMVYWRKDTRLEPSTGAISYADFLAGKLPYKPTIKKGQL